VHPLREKEEEMEEKAVEKMAVKITPTFQYIDIILALHVEFESQLRYEGREVYEERGTRGE
jgi:hypothetical protein